MVERYSNFFTTSIGIGLREFGYEIRIRVSVWRCCTQGRSALGRAPRQDRGEAPRSDQ